MTFFTKGAEHCAAALKTNVLPWLTLVIGLSCLTGCSALTTKVQAILNTKLDKQGLDQGLAHLRQNDQSHPKYHPNMHQWVAQLSQTTASVTWPSNGNDNVISISSASASADASAAQELAESTYQKFVQVRQDSGIPQAEAIECTVDIRDSTGNRLAQDRMGILQ